MHSYLSETCPATIHPEHGATFLLSCLRRFSGLSPAYQIATASCKTPMRECDPPFPSIFADPNRPANCLVQRTTVPGSRRQSVSLQEYRFRHMPQPELPRKEYPQPYIGSP